MSSLSQEDLDAGWDELDATGAAVPNKQAAEALVRTSSPPNSMMVEKTPARTDSLVEPAVSPVLEAPEPIATTDESPTQSATSPIASSGPPPQAPDSSRSDGHAESTSTPESSQLERLPTDLANSEAAAATGSFEVVAERPALFEISHSVPLPLSTSNPVGQGCQVAFLESRGLIEPSAQTVPSDVLAANSHAPTALRQPRHATAGKLSRRGPSRRMIASDQANDTGEPGPSVDIPAPPSRVC